jgi:hypothetical protein
MTCVVVLIDICAWVLNFQEVKTTGPGSIENELGKGEE